MSCQNLEISEGGVGGTASVKLWATFKRIPGLSEIVFSLKWRANRDYFRFERIFLMIFDWEGASLTRSELSLFDAIIMFVLLKYNRELKT